MIFTCAAGKFRAQKCSPALETLPRQHCCWLTHKLQPRPQLCQSCHFSFSIVSPAALFDSECLSLLPCHLPVAEGGPPMCPVGANTLCSATLHSHLVVIKPGSGSCLQVAQQACGPLCVQWGQLMVAGKSIPLSAVVSAETLCDMTGGVSKHQHTQEVSCEA